MTDGEERRTWHWERQPSGSVVVKLWDDTGMLVSTPEDGIHESGIAFYNEGEAERGEVILKAYHEENADLRRQLEEAQRDLAASIAAERQTMQTHTEVLLEMNQANLRLQTALASREQALREIKADGEWEDGTPYDLGEEPGPYDYEAAIDYETKRIYLEHRAIAAAALAKPEVCGKPSSTPEWTGADGRRHCYSGPCVLAKGHEGACSPAKPEGEE